MVILSKGVVVFIVVVIGEMQYSARGIRKKCVGDCRINGVAYDFNTVCRNGGLPWRNVSVQLLHWWQAISPHSHATKRAIIIRCSKPVSIALSHRRCVDNGTHVSNLLPKLWLPFNLFLEYCDLTCWNSNMPGSQGSFVEAV